MQDEYSLIPRGADVPEEADFAFIMDSELMEPLIKKGHRVYVSRREAPGQMEAGLFYYDGRVFCRQFCLDYAGNIHLLCANPDCEGENLHFSKGELGLRCLGKVLTKGKTSAPVYR